MLITAILKDSKEVKRIKNYAPICNPFSWYSKICWFPVKNADVSRTQGCVTWFTDFLYLLWIRYNYAKFNCYWRCVTDFREGDLFAKPRPPHPWAAPKRPNLNRVKALKVELLFNCIKNFRLKSLNTRFLRTCKNTRAHFLHIGISRNL